MTRMWSLGRAALLTGLGLPAIIAWSAAEPRAITATEVIRTAAVASRWSAAARSRAGHGAHGSGMPVGALATVRPPSPALVRSGLEPELGRRHGKVRRPPAPKAQAGARAPMARARASDRPVMPGPGRSTRATPRVRPLLAHELARALHRPGRARPVHDPHVLATDIGEAIGARVEHGVESVNAGLVLEHDDTFLRLRPTGASAGLRGEAGELGLGPSPAGFAVEMSAPGGSRRLQGVLSWTGELRVMGSIEGVHFSAKVSPTRWSMGLSFPSPPMPIDPPQLARLVREATRVASRALGAGEGHADPGEPTIEPGLPPMHRALQTAWRAATTKPRVSADLYVAGPLGRARTPAKGGGGTANLALTICF